MQIIIKMGNAVLDLKLGSADVWAIGRAIVLAAGLYHQQHHQPATAPVQDPFAGSGSLLQVLGQVSSWPLSGSDDAIFIVRPGAFGDDVTAPQTRSSEVTSGQVK